MQEMSDDKEDWTCQTLGCGHGRDDHWFGSCNKCSCYVYDPKNPK